MQNKTGLNASSEEEERLRPVLVEMASASHCTQAQAQRSQKGPGLGLASDIVGLVGRPGRALRGRGCAGMVSCLASSAFQPGLLAAGSYSTRVGLFAADGSHLVATLLGHQGGVTQVHHPAALRAPQLEWGRAGSPMVSGTPEPGSSVLRLWSKRCAVALLVHSLQVSFSPDGNFLYSGARKVRMPVHHGACCPGIDAACERRRAVQVMAVRGRNNWAVLSPANVGRCEPCCRSAACAPRPGPQHSVLGHPQYVCSSLQVGCTRLNLAGRNPVRLLQAAVAVL